MSSVPASLFARVSSVTDVKRSLLSSFALLLYDHVISFDAEVMRIWKHPWSLGKIIFLWTRYFGLAMLVVIVSAFFHPSLSDMSCKNLFLSIIVLGDVLYVSVEVILVARLYVVYNLNRNFTIFLSGICFFASISTLVMAVVFCPDATAIPSIAHLSGCDNNLVSGPFGYSLIPLMVAEAILCFSMLYKAWSVDKNEPASPTLRQLVKDSVFYFFSIFAILFINSFLWIFAPHPLKFIAFGWFYAIYTTLGCRLLLSMSFRREC